MKHFKTSLTALAFAFAGFAVHANAAAKKACADDSVCFQLAPSVAENGSEKTPLGMWIQEHSQVVAENGSDKTPLGMWIESRSQMVAEGGSEHTGAGMWGERQSRV